MRISNVNLYMIDPDRDDVDDDAPGRVVARLDHGWGVVQVASELWRIVDPERADRMDALRRRLNHQDLRMTTTDVGELSALLNDLPGAVVGSLVSADTWTLAPDQVPALRDRAPAIFDQPRPIADEVHAIAEVLQAIDALRSFLNRASASGYEVHAE